MMPIYQRCVVCGFERQNAPSALPMCCNSKMVVILDRDVGQGRKSKHKDKEVANRSARFTNKVLAKRIIPDPEMVLRARFGYGLPEAPKIGHRDETL
jgi:hypothetical protein